MGPIPNAELYLSCTVKTCTYMYMHKEACCISIVGILFVCINSLLLFKFYILECSFFPVRYSVFGLL